MATAGFVAESALVQAGSSVLIADLEGWNRKKLEFRSLNRPWHSVGLKRQPIEGSHQQSPCIAIR